MSNNPMLMCGFVAAHSLLKATKAWEASILAKRQQRNKRFAEISMARHQHAIIVADKQKRTDNV